MTKKANPNQRDKNGRFLQGNTCSTGRPPRETEKAYSEATMSACTPAEWATIVKKAVNDCNDDDMRVVNAARNFLLKALYGSSPSVVMQYANIVTQENEQNQAQNETYYQEMLQQKMNRMLSEPNIIDVTPEPRIDRKETAPDDNV